MAQQSQVRQNFHENSETALNKHAGALLSASYTYLGMAFYFQRDDVALEKLHKFFYEISKKRRDLADKLFKYQNSRGGQVVLQPIQKPAKDHWGSTLEALQAALDVEKALNVDALSFHALADATDDYALNDFIEETLLDEYVDRVKTFADLVTGAKLAGPNLGEYMFERELEDDHFKL